MANQGGSESLHCVSPCYRYNDNPTIEYSRNCIKPPINVETIFTGSFSCWITNFTTYSNPLWACVGSDENSLCVTHTPLLYSSLKQQYHSIFLTNDIYSLWNRIKLDVKNFNHILILAIITSKYFTVNENWGYYTPENANENTKKNSRSIFHFHQNSVWFRF